MIGETTFRKCIFLGQVVFWVLLFLINFLSIIEDGRLIANFAFALTETAYLAAIVYIHYYKLIPLLVKRHWLKYAMSTVSLISFFIGVYFLTDALIHPEYPRPGYVDSGGLVLDLAYYYLLSLIVMAYSSLYYFVEIWHANQRRAAALRNEQLQTKLDLLKSQINPHFLFNTLNNIYSYAQTGNEKTPFMLERLSSILRYMVYDGEHDKVDLKNELRAIEDLLEIHKMKNDGKSNVSFTQKGVKGLHLIPPLILVNFVENACKHSDAIIDSSGFLKVSISVDEADNCHFSISNTFKPHDPTKIEHNGLGLPNLMKRLELQFEDRFSYRESKDSNVYDLELTIPLERRL